VVKYDPYYPFYYFYLGLCHLRLGNLDKGLENLHKVLACEGKVYVTNESFITSVLDCIKDVENTWIPVPKASNKSRKTTTKPVTNTTKNNARKRKKSG